MTLNKNELFVSSSVGFPKHLKVLYFFCQNINIIFENSSAYFSVSFRSSKGIKYKNLTSLMNKNNLVKLCIRIAMEKQLVPSGVSLIKMNWLCCLWQNFKMLRSNPFKWFKTLEQVQKEVTDPCKGIRVHCVSNLLKLRFVMLVYFNSIAKYSLYSCHKISSGELTWVCFTFSSFLRKKKKQNNVIRLQGWLICQ